MDYESTVKKAENYLTALCSWENGRCVGSEGNRDATSLFAEALESFGFQVEKPSFDCFDWHEKGATLMAEREVFHLQASPYSLPCRINAPLGTVTTVEALKTTAAEGKVVLLKGEIAAEALMPKNFIFYNPVEHQEITACLENRGFTAVLTATPLRSEAVRKRYPFPIIEDGDFLLPSGYMTQEEGDRLAAFSGENVLLHINTKRTPARAYNVVARKGEGERRIVFFAHIDSKMGTPGAIDNASGAATLLLLGEGLKNYQGKTLVEIVALNGEDYYSNPGQMLYLEMNKERFTDILLGINIDGIGYHRGKTAYSLYECPRKIAKTIREVLCPQRGFIEGKPWHQGDHSLFIKNEIPALAITSEHMDLLHHFTHTPRDKIQIVDTSQLAKTARALRHLIKGLCECSN